ncbi:outer membrane beta-barrel protein [Flavobacterium sp. NRK1]|uniref:outer membrane beta-barrel protein n=1 Tax=Flavobacterium sp. NRK1 TaxID=2954929 RepID=UPI002092C3EA|nr:outer membrane beta-barrel protein [Flavobacterium sp. NRK1]MCO6148274.1 outer membrane beta-barrel protein [Flavobacterium sp. NRK1]
MHKILTLLLFLCSLSALGQNIILKGKITDKQDFPLEAATIYLTTVKDSSIVDYTISDKNGNWELKVKKITDPVFLKISYVGLANYKKEYAAIEQDTDFGTIKLEDQATELNEVVIESEVPPIRIKKDTLEFNASSFKVRPNANVEALLKQLPGVDIDTEGKITVNGKEVNQILVNGKPFFDSDGQIAIKNLPAEIIDKVQVSDTKTRKEELSGQKASGDNSSINLTIKKDKNKGIFGKFLAGYGSDKRYESSAILNYFKDKRKISLLASSNNINASGFSMNDIFGSMGGGRNTYSAFSGGGRGITKSDLLGLNYNDEWFKDFDASVSYSYKNSNTENNNRTDAINYLPESEDKDNPGTIIDKSYRTNSTSRSENDRTSHDFNTDFKFKIDSTSTISLTPKFSVSNSKTTNKSESFSERLTDNRPMNESKASSVTENDNNSFSNQLTYYKAFNSRKGRGISLTMNNNNTKNDGNRLNQSNTVKYKYPAGVTETEVDNRDQIIYDKDNSDSYSAGFEYTEPITDSLNINIGTSYNTSSTVNNRHTYDFDEETGKYSVYSDSLSSYTFSRTTTFSPRTGINISKNKLNVYINLGTDVTSFKNYAFYVDKEYRFNKDYVVASANLNLSYRFEKGTSISGGYNYSVNYPQANQLLAIEDKSNPLNTYIGNPNLSPTGSHSIRANYRNYNTSSRSGFFLWANVSFYENQVTSYSKTNDSGITETTYKNISGAMSAYINPFWNKTFTKEANTYRVGVGLGTSYNVNKGFLNEKLYNSKSIILSPYANFTYEYGELLVISPSYHYNYNEYNYTNYRINSTANYVHRFNLQTTSYWPKHVVFGNDFGYTYNSNISGNFKKDFYLWNTSIGYNFLNDDLMFMVKVYDVLNQNLGTSRTIGPTTITDQENTVLKRYIMFSLSYKIGEFGGKTGKDKQGGKRNGRGRRKN